MTLAGPAEDGEWSYGVRVGYSSSSPVRVAPFTVPGRPLRDLQLYGSGRASLPAEEFGPRVAASGGQVFDDEDHYTTHLAARVWGCTPRELFELTARIREVRNPALLQDISVTEAAAALRASLPGVADEVIDATADALAESEATRAAFERDTHAADLLTEFAAAWAGHVAAVMGGHAETAERDLGAVQAARRAIDRCTNAAERTAADAAHAARAHHDNAQKLGNAQAELRALEDSARYQSLEKLTDRKRTAEALAAQSKAATGELAGAAEACRDRGRGLRDRLNELSDSLADVVGTAVAADPAAAAYTPHLGWTDEPAHVIAIGDATADPGASLRVDTDPAAMRAAAHAWQACADGHTRRADAAKIAVTAHRPVAAAETTAGRAEQAAAGEATAADRASHAAGAAAHQAVDQARAVLADILLWRDEHPDLAAARRGQD